VTTKKQSYINLEFKYLSDSNTNSISLHQYYY